MLELRPMTMGDAMSMYKWKNYPETRRFAIAHHNPIAKRDHLKFLKKNLKYFQVVMWKGRTAGAIRIQDGEVSIWIDKKWWGIGLATNVLTLVSKQGYTAKIVNANLASMRCFIKAGYVPVEYREEGYYIFKKQ